MLINFYAFWAKNLGFCPFFCRQTTELFMTSVFKNAAACIVIEPALVEMGQSGKIQTFPPKDQRKSAIINWSKHKVVFILKPSQHL